MFSSRGHILEEVLRNSTTGKLERFVKALDKYPPVYEIDITPGKKKIFGQGRESKNP
jgi:hypothetical protein